MKVNQLKFGSVLTYIQMALKLVVGIAYTPIMLRLLGQSEFGLYNTVSSTISMLSILSLGFNSGYIRYYSGYKAKDDSESINKLNGLFLIVFLIIGVIALICGTYLTQNLRLVFNKGLTDAEYVIARKLMLLLTVNLAISFPMSVFQNIISANEKYIFLKLMAIIKTVLSPLVTLPLLLIGLRSVAMVSVTVAVSVLIDVFYLIYSKKVLNVKFKFGGFEKGLFKNLFSFTFFIALSIIVDQANNNVGKFLLGRFNGTSAVAKYSIGSDLYIYFTLFSTAISGVFTPRIHRMVNQTNQDKAVQRSQLTKTFTSVGRIQFLVLALIATGLYFFGEVFIYHWAGDGYKESYYVAVCLVFSVFVPLIQNLGVEIQRAMDKHKFRSIAYVIMAVVNIILTIYLCQKLGAVGAAIGTALSFIIMNGLVMNIYYHKRCNIDIISFWKEILHLSAGLICPIVFGLIITSIFKFKSVLGMLFGIIIYTIVYIVSMWFFGMNEYEKNLIRTPLKKLVGRK